MLKIVALLLVSTYVSAIPFGFSCGTSGGASGGANGNVNVDASVGLPKLGLGGLFDLVHKVGGGLESTIGGAIKQGTGAVGGITTGISGAIGQSHDALGHITDQF
ncbi:unnamed protein product, partial [Medioppia subpectinata]